MLSDIQNSGPEYAFEDCCNKASKQDDVGGQQECAPGEMLQVPNLGEEKDKDGSGEHNIEDFIVLKHA